MQDADPSDRGYRSPYGHVPDPGATPAPPPAIPPTPYAVDGRAGYAGGAQGAPAPGGTASGHHNSRTNAQPGAQLGGYGSSPASGYGDSPASGQAGAQAAGYGSPQPGGYGSRPSGQAQASGHAGAQATGFGAALAGGYGNPRTGAYGSPQPSGSPGTQASGYGDQRASGQAGGRQTDQWGRLADPGGAAGRYGYGGTAATGHGGPAGHGTGANPVVPPAVPLAAPAPTAPATPQRYAAGRGTGANPVLPLAAPIPTAPANPYTATRGTGANPLLPPAAPTVPANPHLRALPPASDPSDRLPAVRLPPTPYESSAGTGAFAAAGLDTPGTARPYVVTPPARPQLAGPAGSTGFLSAPPLVESAGAAALAPAWTSAATSASRPAASATDLDGWPPALPSADPDRSPSAARRARAEFARAEYEWEEDKDSGSPSGRRWILVVAGVAAVGVAGALVTFVIKSNGQPGTPAAEQTSVAGASPPAVPAPAASGGQGNTGPGASQRPKRSTLPAPPVNGSGACGAQGTVPANRRHAALTAQRCTLRLLGPTGSRIPVYRTRSGNSRVVGWLNRAGNGTWFVGEALGARFTAAGDYNNNWAYTQANTGAWGWVPGLYFSVGTTGRPDPSLASCGNRCHPY